MRSGQALFTVAEIARAIGWTRQRTQRWLDRAGVVSKTHGRLIVTCDALRSGFPQAWQALHRIDTGP